jgi:hypothetical protein
MARAAGIMLLHDGRVLLLKRAASAKDAPSTWGLPGGRVEKGESDEDAARREYGEECGTDGYKGDLTPLFTSRDGFKCYVGSGYAEPTLNGEHTDWKWASFDDLPKPLHPSLIEELRNMPSTSEKQHKAMEAAAHGHSTLGIPQKVGKEFVRADEHAKDSEPQAAGNIERLHGIADWFISRGKK